MNHVTYSRLLDHIRQGEVAEVTITAQTGASPVTARLRDGRTVQAMLPDSNGSAMTLMLEKQVNVDIVSPPPSLWNALPFALLVAAWLVLYWTKRGPKLSF